MRLLSQRKITARRHQVFEEFATRALAATECTEACKYAETALKALSGTEHEPPFAPATVAADPLSRFQDDLTRAYAAD